MLLAEALALRADHQKKLKALSDRIASNARAPLGHDPDEDPDALLGEAAALTEELAALIRSINETNAGTVADPETGASITDLIAERDKARQMTALYRSAAQAAGRGSGRGFLSYDRDAPTAATMDVPALQKQADGWAEAYREIDVRLQQLNWATDVIE